MASYVISDLHGDYNAWTQFRHCIGHNDRCYVLGDSCDRGSNGVKILLEIKEDPRFEYLVGNHDDFVIRTYCPEKVHSLEHSSSWGESCWQYNYKPSIHEWEDFRINNPTVFKETIKWLTTRKVFCQVMNHLGDLFFLAHAKYPEYYAPSSATWEELEMENHDLLFSILWDRYSEIPLSRFVTPGVTTIIGHTPLQAGANNVCPGLVNVDCGLGHGSTTLGIYSLTNKRMHYIDYNHPVFFRENGGATWDIKDLIYESSEDGSIIGSLIDPKRGFFGRVKTSPIKDTFYVGNYKYVVTQNSIYNIINP